MTKSKVKNIDVEETSQNTMKTYFDVIYDVENTLISRLSISESFHCFVVFWFGWLVCIKQVIGSLTSVPGSFSLSQFNNFRV